MEEKVDEKFVSEVVRNDYFLRLMEDEVAKKTAAELSTWWKRVAATTAIVLSILGFFGIREILSLRKATEEVEGNRKAIQAKMVEIDKQFGELDMLRKESDILLKGAQELSGIVKSSVSESGQNIKQSHDLMGESFKFLDTSRASIEGSLTSFSQRQQELSEQAKLTNAQALEVVRHGLEGLKEAQSSLDNAKTTLAEIEKAKTAVAESYAEIRDNAETVRNLRGLSTELAKAKTFVFFMVEQGDTREVEIAGQKVRFSPSKISKALTLTVQVEPQPGRSLSSVQTEVNLVQGNRFPIHGTDNIWCEVNAIRYRRIGPDFVFLRVFAGDSIASS